MKMIIRLLAIVALQSTVTEKAYSGEKVNPRNDMPMVAVGTGGTGFSNYHLRLDAGVGLVYGLGARVGWGHTIWNVMDKPYKKDYLDAGLNFCLVGFKGYEKTKVGLGSSSSGGYRYFGYTKRSLLHYYSLNLRGGYLITNVKGTASDSLYRSAVPKAIPYHSSPLEIARKINIPYVGLSYEDKTNEWVQLSGGKRIPAVYRKTIYFDILLLTNERVDGYVGKTAYEMERIGTQKKRGWRLGYSVANGPLAIGAEVGFLSKPTSADSKAKNDAYLNWKATYMIGNAFLRKKKAK